VKEGNWRESTGLSVPSVFRCRWPDSLQHFGNEIHVIRRRTSRERGGSQRGVAEVGEGATAGLGMCGGEWGEGTGAVPCFQRKEGGDGWGRNIWPVGQGWQREKGGRAAGFFLSWSVGPLALGRPS
jgi:hypothetical protein